MCVVRTCSRSQTGKCWSLRSAQGDICTLSKTHIHSTLCVRSLFSKGYLCTLKSPVFKGVSVFFEKSCFQRGAVHFEKPCFQRGAVHFEKPCFQRGICAL